MGSSREVVIHPVAIRYSFDGDVETAVAPVLDELEARLSWQPQHHLPMIQRIAKLGDAFLSLKEVEYLGVAQSGNPYDRADHFIEAVLGGSNRCWQQKDTSGGVVARVKRLRTVILPDMVRRR